MRPNDTDAPNIVVLVPVEPVRSRKFELLQFVEVALKVVTPELLLLTETNPVCGVPGYASETLVVPSVYVPLVVPLMFKVTGIVVWAPPLPGVMVMDPCCVEKMLVALANTLMVTLLEALTWLLLADTFSQLVKFAGVVVKLKETGVALEVVRVIDADADWLVNALNVTELGLAAITPPLDPPLQLPPAGQKVTGTCTSVPPPVDVGCSVNEPLQVTPPFEQTVLATLTNMSVGAVPEFGFTEKKPPVTLVMVKFPEPPTETSTLVVVPVRATGFGVALS